MLKNSSISFNSYFFELFNFFRGGAGVSWAAELHVFISHSVYGERITSQINPFHGLPALLEHPSMILQRPSGWPVNSQSKW
jgi:hypothetical protein